MPTIQSFTTMQSTVMGWQKKDVRGKPDFPKFTPRYQTSDLFSYRYPTTSRYRQTLDPAQVYSGVSREEYIAHLKTTLAQLPTEKTLQIRWRLSKERPAFSLEFLKVFLSRKYGPVESIYQEAVNSCLVVFKHAESAFSIGRDHHAGHPHGRLYTRRWNPTPQDDSYCRVMKHIEKAAETRARFNLMMDHADRQTVVRPEHGYARALTCRNKMYGPSMLPVLTHGQGLEGAFTTILGSNSLTSRSSHPAVPELPPHKSAASRVREAETHEEFLRFLRAMSLTVVKFHATWCGPCKAVAPQVDSISLEEPGVMFISVDVDENSKTSDHCDVAMLPTFQFYIKGHMVDEVRGNSVQVLREKIKTMKQILIDAPGGHNGHSRGSH